MDLERLEAMLKAYGFISFKTDIEQLTLHYVSNNNTGYLLLACDFRRGIVSDLEQFKYTMQAMVNDTRFGTGEKQILALVCTNNLDYGKYLIQQGIPAWIVDTAADRLMIYDEQPSDFAGIREPLEKMLENRTAERRTDYKQFSPVNTLLVIVNVLVFLAMTVAGAVGDSNQMIKWGAMYTPLMEEPRELYRVITSMFLHFDVSHLTGNMIVLIALGDNLERALGKWRYLTVYFLSGAGAGIASFVYNEIVGNTVVAAGASGAIFGVIGTLFCMVVMNRGKLEDITAFRLGVMIVYVLYTGLKTPGIDNAAHIGGLLTGVLLTGLMRGNINKKRGKR